MPKRQAIRASRSWDCWVLANTLQKGHHFDMAEKKYNGYMREYLKEKYKRISLIFSYEKDMDIIEALDENNIQASIKRLIRSGIEADK